MTPDSDVRDRLIDAAMRYANHEAAIRSRTLRMKASKCDNSPSCRLSDPTHAWRRPEVEVPESYCEACAQGTILARERQALKDRRPLVKGGLLRAAGAFKCAGPRRGEAEADKSSASAEKPPWINSPSSSVTL